LYAYAKSSPTEKVDPEGQQTGISLPRPGFTPLPPIFIPGTPENRKWTGQAIKSAQELIAKIQNICRRETQKDKDDDGERCRKVKQSCHTQCVDYAFDHPIGGIRGSDRPAHYRRCMRQCMKDADCPFE
jgi:hypothetical protein